jgi:phosphate:Na+ symporter
VAVALSATAGGMISLEGAAGMVIGANLGTTSTAVFAAIGATSNAKRVALSHVIFNLVTAVVAVILLRSLIEVIDLLTRTAHLPEGPVSVLAVFHTAFNILGVLLMWPVSRRLIRWLETRFVTEEEDEARPRYLDSNIAVVPALAIQGAYNETGRLLELATAALRASLSDTLAAAAHTRRHRDATSSLARAIGDYTRRIFSERLSETEALAIQAALRAAQHFTDLAEIATELAAWRWLPGSLPESSAASIRALRGEAIACVEEVRDTLPSSTEADLDVIEERYKSAYRKAKAELLQAGATGAITVDELNQATQMIEHVRDSAERAVKGGLRMLSMRDMLKSQPAPGDAAGKAAAA